MTIGQRITAKRKELGLSQEALGEALGVSRQAIYKWESDSALPEIEKLIALSRLFGVSVGWLLGVEEAAEADAPAGGELSEAQMQMVQEIADRYLAAQPQPKKSPWGKWDVRILFAICGLILGCLVGLNSKIQQMDARYHDLNSAISNVRTDVNSQISGISSRVEEVLKSQNTLTADYSAALLGADLSAGTVTFALRAVPKTYVEGMTGTFLADAGNGELLEFSGMLGEGQAFTAEITCPLTDSIDLSVVFASGGRRETQLLDHCDGLYSQSFPFVRVDELDLMYLELDSRGRLPLNGVYLFTSGNAGGSAPARNGALPAAALRSVQVGLFKNYRLVDWAEPCEPPASHRSMEGQFDFYLLPSQTLELEQGDVLSVAALVTDTYGRTVMACGMEYVLDPENRCLTWPDEIKADPDPGSWHF